MVRPSVGAPTEAQQGGAVPAFEKDAVLERDSHRVPAVVPQGYGDVARGDLAVSARDASPRVPRQERAARWPAPARGPLGAAATRTGEALRSRGHTLAERVQVRHSQQHGCCSGCRLGTMGHMIEREVYPNAPVVLVALEVRHAAADPMGAEAITRVKKVLSDVTPLHEPQTISGITITPAGPPTQTVETAQRFSSRDRSTAVTFRSGAFMVETTRYGRYEDLREVIGLALLARESAGAIDGVLRIGLRYIDEVRVPGDDGLLGWAEWVDQSLLGPALLASQHNLIAAQWQGLAVFDGAAGAQLALRYGPGEGYAVDPGGELRRPAPAPGPFFLVDIDSFWVPDPVPDFDVTAMLQRCDDLHGPVRALFERLITARLREEVLRGVG